MGPTDHAGGKGSPTQGNGVAARLLANKDRILARWVARIRREIEPAEKERHPVLIDTFPMYLRRMAEALSPEHPRTLASEGTTITEEHGSERARMTRYEPRHVIQEYQVLRDVVMETLEEWGPLTGPERRTIIGSIDRAVRESCTAFFLVQSHIREQFTAGLTHDLRTPLTAAKAAAALILRRSEDPKVPRWATQVIENVERIDRMVRDMLDASRLQSGEGLPLEFSACELVSLVQDTVAQLATIHGARFDLHAPDSIRGHWSTDALRRAVENLCVNAIKYGSDRAPVTLTLRSIHERALLSVHNEGSYIPPEEQEGIFQTFRRRGDAQHRGQRGWGLGLAQVRGVAEAHGGSIAVDSLPERGTTFTIDILCDARPRTEPAD